jgi:hypothetical protein
MGGAAAAPIPPLKGDRCEAFVDVFALNLGVLGALTFYLLSFPRPAELFDNARPRCAGSLAVAITSERLQTIIEYLKERPGHENVRGILRELWVVGLDVPDREINFEVPVPEVSGRLDALFGSTVFEIKRDLRREKAAAEKGLTRYIRDREKATGRRYLGIATDGAEFVAYELKGGRLNKLEEFIPSSENPAAFLRWLDTATAIREDIYPDPITIREEFGRDSLVFRRSMEDLRALWEQAQSIPEAHLKKELWGRHLEFVYGTLIEPDELFLQHTYLTIVAKTMAVRVLTTGPIRAGDLLSGTPFTQVGLHGAVEADFSIGCFWSSLRASSWSIESPPKQLVFVLQKSKLTY